jgi:hypothetical protein
MTLFAICTAASTSAGCDTPFYYCLLSTACCQRPGDCICLNIVCRALGIEQCVAGNTVNVTFSNLDSRRVLMNGNEEGDLSLGVGTEFHIYLQAKNEVQ